MHDQSQKFFPIFSYFFCFPFFSISQMHTMLALCLTPARLPACYVGFLTITEYDTCMTQPLMTTERHHRVCSCSHDVQLSRHADDGACNAFIVSFFTFPLSQMYALMPFRHACRFCSHEVQPLPHKREAQAATVLYRAVQWEITEKLTALNAGR
jgi:hypothetical protein